MPDKALVPKKSCDDEVIGHCGHQDSTVRLNGHIRGFRAQLAPEVKDKPPAVAEGWVEHSVSGEAKDNHVAAAYADI